MARGMVRQLVGCDQEIVPSPTFLIQNTYWSTKGTTKWCSIWDTEPWSGHNYRYPCPSHWRLPRWKGVFHDPRGWFGGLFWTGYFTPMYISRFRSLTWSAVPLFRYFHYRMVQSAKLHFIVPVACSLHSPWAITSIIDKPVCMGNRTRRDVINRVWRRHKKVEGTHTTPFQGLWLLMRIIQRQLKKPTRVRKMTCPCSPICNNRIGVRPRWREIFNYPRSFAKTMESMLQSFQVT